jgi:hypothetical protein
MQREYYKPIEYVTGSGELLKPDGSSLPVSYVLNIIQKFFEVTSEPTPIAGLKEITGKVFGLSESDLWHLQGQDLTLVLQDKRTLPIQLQPDGNIIPGGSLSPPH